MKFSQKLPGWFTFSFFFTVSASILMVIPFAQLLLFLLLFPVFPLLTLYDYLIPGRFTESSEHVTFAFAGMAITSVEGWLFYVSFFYILSLLLYGLKRFSEKFGKLALFVFVGIVAAIWIGSGFLANSLPSSLL